MHGQRRYRKVAKPDQSARTPYTRQPCSPELRRASRKQKKKDKQTDNNDQRSPTSCVADTTHGYRWCRSSIVAVRWATRPTRRGHHHRIRDSLRDCGIRMNHLVNSAERKMCPTLRTLVIVWMRVCGDWGRGHGGPRSRTVLHWILSRRWSLHIRLRG